MSQRGVFVISVLLRVWVTASNQLTIILKNGKIPFLGFDPGWSSPSNFRPCQDSPYPVSECLVCIETIHLTWEGNVCYWIYSSTLLKSISFASFADCFMTANNRLYKLFWRSPIGFPQSAKIVPMNSFWLHDPRKVWASEFCHCCSGKNFHLYTFRLFIFA